MDFGSIGTSILSLAIRWLFPSVPRSIAVILIAIVGIMAILLVFAPWQQHSPLYYESYPGFQSIEALKIKDAAKLNRQYVFEYETPERAKAAFYFSDTGDRFIFSVTDVHGAVQSLDFKVGKEIPLYRFIFLTCQLGLGTAETYLRVFIDGKEMQSKTLPFRMDFGSRQWHGNIGADLNGKNNAAFERLAISAIGHITMTDQQIKSVITDLRPITELR
jgi:hypothetical protein